MSTRPVSSVVDRNYHQIRKLTFATGAVVYQVRIKAAGVERRVPTRQEAIAIVETTRADLLAGTVVKVTKTGTTVADAVAAFTTKLNLDVARGDRQEGTVGNYVNSLGYLVKEHGDLPLARLTTRHLEALITKGVTQGIQRNDKARKQGRPWSTGTVNLFITSVNVFLDHAVKQRTVPVNVCRAGITRHKVRARDRFQPTVFDAAGLVAALEVADRTGHLGIAWRLGLSGLRRGEIAGLRWEDIDYVTGDMTVRNARVSNNGRVQEKDPKSGKERVYPMPPALVKAFRAHRRAQAEARLLVGEAWTETGYVVVNDLGQPYHPETITTRWFSWLAANGMPRIRLHDARHTFATFIANTPGVDIAEVAELLGHSRKSFTLDTYVHSTPQRLKAAVDVFDQLTSSGT